MTARYYIREGGVEAEITDLMPQIRRALGESRARIADEVERETRQIYATARELWPVGTRGERRSRDTLTWSMLIHGDTIEGRVRAGAPYARYIRSGQISSLPAPTLQTYSADRHRNANIARQEHPSEAEVRDDFRARRAHQARAQRHAQRLGKAGRKAARLGMPMWLLLRWPEAAAAERLLESVGPLIEAELQRTIGGT